MNEDEIAELFNSPINEQIENLLDRMVFIGDNHFIFAAPDNIPADLEIKMLAAVKAYVNGYRSVDYVLKTYGDNWNLIGKLKENPDNSLYDLLYKSLCEVGKVCDWWANAEKNGATSGIILAGAALMRLQSSFRVASLLIRLGYVHEAASILRIILEQIAWAYKVHGLSDQDDPLRVPTKKAITSLKELFPDSIGNLYSLLSAYTHISDEDARSFLVPEKNGEDWLVIRKTHEPGGFLILIFLQLADTYYIVSEYVHRNYVQNPKSIRIDEKGKFQFVRKRPVAELIDMCMAILAKQEAERDAKET